MPLTGGRKPFRNSISGWSPPIERWNTVPDSRWSYPLAKLPLPKMSREIRFRPMNLDELKRLASDGHLVGCHSWDHRPLAALSDEELRKDFELCESERWILSGSASQSPKLQKLRSLSVPSLAELVVPCR